MWLDTKLGHDADDSASDVVQPPIGDAAKFIKSLLGFREPTKWRLTVTGEYVIANVRR